LSVFNQTEEFDDDFNLELESSFVRSISKDKENVLKNRHVKVFEEDVSNVIIKACL